MQRLNTREIHDKSEEKLVYQEQSSVRDKRFERFVFKGLWKEVIKLVLVSYSSLGVWLFQGVY